MMQKARESEMLQILLYHLLMPRHLDDEVSHPWTIVWGLLFLGFVTPA